MIKEILKRWLITPLRRMITPLIVPAVDHCLLKDSRDIERWRRRNSLEETGRFVEEHMPCVQSDVDDLSLLSRAIRALNDSDDGLVCEFGVASGRTINHIAKQLPARTVFGFDSFEGLPEDWRDGVPRGTFARARLPHVRENVKLIKGLFNDTLPGFVADNPGSALFLHVDCDLYSSTKTVLQLLSDKIGPGTVIVFDEYFNYPGWQEGEYKAFMEFIDSSGLSFEYIGYCRYHSQVAVRIV